MEYLRSFELNQKNPKNIKIPFTTFIAMEMLFKKLDVGVLSPEEKAIYEIVKHELDEKRNRIVNRQNYTAMLSTQTEDEKQAAYENYRLTREFAK